MKEGIVDPEGENTMKTLRLLGFSDVRKVSSMKLYSVDIEAGDQEAERRIEEICRKLLANPAIHNYSYRKVK